MKSAFPGKGLLRVGGVLLVLAFLDHFLPYWIDPYYFRILGLLTGLNIILAVSLNIINGFTGQFSLGHAGFMAVGAYTSSAFTAYVINRPAEGMSFWAQTGAMLFILLLGGLAGGLAGLLVGIPSLRLRGDYLAIVTLGFGEIIRVLIQNIPQVGGASGFPGSVPVQIPALTRFFWIWGMALATVTLSRNLLQSSHGRALLAVREDERAAEALGINTTYYKVLAFVLSSSLAGIGGALFAHLDAYIHPDSFTFLQSIEMIVMVIIGGMGSTTGAVLGAVIVTWLPEILRNLDEYLKVVGISLPFSLKEYRMVLYAVLLILMMLTRPHGLVGGRELSYHTLDHFKIALRKGLRFPSRFSRKD